MEMAKVPRYETGGFIVLVLSRKNRESVVIGGSGGCERIFKVTVVEISGASVKLGFEVDGDIPVHRLEVYERIKAAGPPWDTLDDPATTPSIE
jgi:carbon storage regulator CsrA